MQERANLLTEFITCLLILSLFKPFTAMKYHGDNAAMVGSQGYYEFLNGNRASLNLNARACEPIN